MSHKTKITYPKIAAYAFDYPVYSGKHSFSPVDFVEDGFIDIKSNNDQNYFVDTYITGVDYYSAKSSERGQYMAKYIFSQALISDFE
ncbi:MAG: hypothetical protein HWD59_09530 [Coxiellaceae bacterium]|nr:MAG: hypothetical protein HWD59_09530 [Coxiellaceae bacterium]